MARTRSNSTLTGRMSAPAQGASASIDRQRTRTPPTQQRASATRRSARNIRVAHPRAPPRTNGNEHTIVHITGDGNQTEDFVTSNTGVAGVQSGIPGGVAPGRAGQLDGSSSPQLRRSSRVRRQNTERVQAITAETGHRESIAGGDESASNAEGEEDDERDSEPRKGTKRGRRSAETRMSRAKLPRETSPERGDNEQISESDGDRGGESDDGDKELVLFCPDRNIIYTDLFGTSCSLSTSDCSSLRIMPDEPIPESVLHFLAQHILTAESMRSYPDSIDTFWWRDKCFSPWILSRMEGESDDAERAPDGEEINRFSEHNERLLTFASKQQVILIPFLADGRNSLFVITGLKEFLDHTRNIIASGREIQEAMPDIEPQASHEVFEFCLRRRNTRRTYNTCVYHVGSAVEVHEKYRPAIRRWIEEFCYRVLHDSDQHEVIEAGVQAAITGKFEVKTLGISHVDPLPAADGLLCIGYLLAFLERSTRDRITEDAAEDIPKEYFKLSELVKITNVALENHEVAGKTRGYRPFEIFGDDLLGLLETHVKVRGRFSCDKVVITPTIPVAAEVLLFAMDQHIAENRDALEKVQDKSDSHIDEREWAFAKVLPRLTKPVLFHRGGKKMPRARLERFWNCLFKDVKGMTPYHECLPIFSTMRRFPGSALVSIGLDYLYGKDSLLARIPTERPSYPAECNPWKIFKAFALESTTLGWRAGLIREHGVGCKRLVSLCLDSLSSYTDVYTTSTPLVTVVWQRP